MKTKYRTEEAAQKAIAFIWGNDPGVSLGDLHTYRCPKCHMIHIGHVRKPAPAGLGPVIETEVRSNHYVKK